MVDDKPGNAPDPGKALRALEPEERADASKQDTLDALDTLDTRPGGLLAGHTSVEAAGEAPDALAARDAAAARKAAWAAPVLIELTEKGERLLVETLAPRAVAKTPLNTPRDTWRWLWKDTLTRVTPFLIASWAFGRFTPEGWEALGLRGDDLLGDLALGVLIGAPFAQISAVFRRMVAPGYRLPTRADHLFQSAYYFILNAPAEELFWRGVVQTLATRGLRRAPGARRAAAPLGWALTTSVFGAYHRLGGWSWRSILGVTVAGGLFGAVFAGSRRRSILPVIVAHGFATAGFLNWGDAALHAWHMRRLRRQVVAEQ